MTILHVGQDRMAISWRRERAVTRRVSSERGGTRAADLRWDVKPLVTRGNSLLSFWQSTPRVPWRRWRVAGSSSSQDACGELEYRHTVLYDAARDGFWRAWPRTGARPRSGEAGPGLAFAAEGARGAGAAAQVPVVGGVASVALPVDALLAVAHSFSSESVFEDSHSIGFQRAVQNHAAQIPVAEAVG